jgi:hypothetical protein
MNPAWVSAIAESVAATAVFAAAVTWLVKQARQAISQAASRAARKELGPIAEDVKASTESVAAKAMATADRDRRASLVAAAVNVGIAAGTLAATFILRTVFDHRAA